MKQKPLPTISAKERKNMKTRNLLITLVAAVLIAGTNLYATDPLLSPRAAGNVVKKVVTSSDSFSVVDANVGRTISPRAIGNEIKTVAGTSTGAVPTCSKMAGSPKMIAECVSHPGTSMACCKVADVK
jgi:hypothetical protein